MEISILTLSTSACRGDYRARLDLMVRETAALAPDVILLQDVFATVDGRYNTATTMGRCLSMAAAFHPARPAERHLDGRPIDCHAGLAVLSRLPIQRSMRVELPCDPDRTPRICQVAELSLGARSLLVVNVQIETDAQGAAVAEIVEEAHHFDHILVCGDFGAAHRALDPVGAFAPTAAQVGTQTLVVLDRYAAPRSLLRARAALERRDTITGLTVAERPALLAELHLRGVRPHLIRAAE